MPVRGLHHLDVAVADVDRSLEFYLARLGPLGVCEYERYPTYRGTEEVVCLAVGDQFLSFRQADGGEHRYYDVGIEHFALSVDSHEELQEIYRRALGIGAKIHFPPEEDRDIPGYWGLFIFETVSGRTRLLARSGR